jgi:hypothetical protein
MSKLVLVVCVSLSACAAQLDRSLAPNEPAHVSSLAWTGIGKVFPAGQVLELGVSTSVVPFVSARSETWQLEKGRSTTRTMIIEPEGGWIERDGKREPMPADMLEQERQQFALYGQMQLAIAQASISRAFPRKIMIKGDGVRSVDTEFVFDARKRLVEARNEVTDHDAASGKAAQVFKFSGEVKSNGLHWPRRMEMYRGTSPYFVLEISSFRAQ